jgi:hypothetical protein
MWLHSACAAAEAEEAGRRRKKLFVVSAMLFVGLVVFGVMSGQTPPKAGPYDMTRALSVAEGAVQVAQQAEAERQKAPAKPSPARPRPVSKKPAPAPTMDTAPPF